MLGNYFRYLSLVLYSVFSSLQRLQDFKNVSTCNRLSAQMSEVQLDHNLWPILMYLTTDIRLLTKVWMQTRSVIHTRCRSIYHLPVQLPQDCGLCSVALAFVECKTHNPFNVNFLSSVKLTKPQTREKVT